MMFGHWMVEWTVLQLSIMIIYNSTRSILISIGLGIYCQVTTWPSKYNKKAYFVCNKPANVGKIKNLWNYALVDAVQWMA